MKTIKNRIITTVIFVLFTCTGFAQNTYLKITLCDVKHDYVSFPPGTKFELRNMNNKVVYTDKNASNLFLINKKHQLTVYPDWKKTIDVFHITNGKVERIDTRLFGKISSKKSQPKPYTHNKAKYTNSLKMKKTLEASKRNVNLYNATFKFSNGIIAKYVDGEFKAKLNNKDLTVGYKYFIYFDSGIIKLSFNPKNGETWWVFQKYQ